MKDKRAQAWKAYVKAYKKATACEEAKAQAWKAYEETVALTQNKGVGMEKSFDIKLTPKKVSFLYARFNVCTDAQLGNALQKAVDALITYQSPKAYYEDIYEYIADNELRKRREEVIRSEEGDRK